MSTFKALRVAAAAACAVAGVLAALGGVSVAGAAGMVTRTFAYTGGEQTFHVPAGVSSVKVLAIGGSGGSFEETRGGQAAQVSAEMSVTPGTTPYVEVGREGTQGGCELECPGAGGGGGASDVRTSPRASGPSPDTRRLVAGAGGGAGLFASGHESGAGGAAGQAGESSVDGTESQQTLAEGGGGGSQTGGGAGGHGECTNGKERPGGAGQLEAGGSGGFCSRLGGIEGGGGGAGYYGGGGGGAAVFSGGGGGGGSSLVPAGGSLVLAPLGTATQVQFSYTQPPNPPAVITEAASAIARTSATLNASVNPEDAEVSSCYFEYGESPSYGSSTPCASSAGSGISPVAVSASVMSLSVHTTYHFRIVATNPHGTSRGGDQTFKTLLHNPPTVTSVSPQVGPETGGTSVTITGTELAEASAVRFGSTNATSFKINSPESMTAVSPKGVGAVDVSVSTPDGTSPQNPAARFTFEPPPTVKSVSPKNGPATGGTSVTITGSNFTGVTAVSFGSTSASKFTLNSATSITAISPAAKPRRVDVTVTTPNGTSAHANRDRFTFKKAKSPGSSRAGTGRTAPA